MSKPEHIIPVEGKKFNYVLNKLQDFCRNEDFSFVWAQHLPSILSSCEDPFNMFSYIFNGEKWPMIQTNQMQLEDELLQNPTKYTGLYTITTSYRNEPDPIPGRHSRIFPMFEFESPGHFEDLKNFIKRMLLSFGYKEENFIEVNYEDAAKEFGVKELTSEHEMELYKKHGKGSVIFLCLFPEHTSPFWNMKRCQDSDLSYKLDVLMGGHETFGTAERSCDVEQMRQSFKTITEGGYAQKIYDEFGVDRVNAELEEYLSYDFKSCPRYGGGIGITRLINGLEADGMLPDPL